MASFNPKIFTKPDGLKRIANPHLIALLDPWRTYFAGRGLQVPTDPAVKFPHGELAELLMTYDPGMPIELMNGLYYIDETYATSTLDDLLDRAAPPLPLIPTGGRVALAVRIQRRRRYRVT